MTERDSEDLAECAKAYIIPQSAQNHTEKEMLVLGLDDLEAVAGLRAPHA